MLSGARVKSRVVVAILAVSLSLGACGGTLPTPVTGGIGTNFQSQQDTAIAIARAGGTVPPTTKVETNPQSSLVANNPTATPQSPTNTTAPTKIPEATATPKPTVDSTPSQVVNLDGTGDKVSQKLSLPKGIARFTLTHSGAQYFGVTLLGSDGNPTGLPAGEIGKFSGSTLVVIRQAGDYVLNIKADGSWTIMIETMNDLKKVVPSGANTYSGTGKSTIKMNVPKAGLATFKMTHKGTQYFSVTGYDKDGNINNLWAGEIGSYSGEKAARLPDGDYYLGIVADGEWTIEISQ